MSKQEKKELSYYSKEELAGMGYNEQEINEIIEERPGDICILMGFMEDWD